MRMWFNLRSGPRSVCVFVELSILENSYIVNSFLFSLSPSVRSLFIYSSSLFACWFIRCLLSFFFVLP